ncbi:hypothetical protein F5880DRAFT_994096 [Lentinula raphanica]|nr:hypothetical protein F5880DRAFT_994096 [Lentinula raphanica]
MAPLRFPARRLLATTLLLSTFLCAIAAPLSLPVPGGGGNSSPTAPGNNATSVSGINAPPVPGNNAPPVSGANPPPGSETCKQVADLNLPSDKGFVFAISSVELPLDPGIEASKQPMRGDQFQLLFQNNANSKDEITFRLYLKAGNPCLVSGFPTSPAFKKDPEAADKKRPCIGAISFKGNKLKAREDFFSQVFKAGAGAGEPTEKLEVQRDIAYLRKVIYGPVMQYARWGFAQSLMKFHLRLVWNRREAVMNEEVARWEKERK